MEETKYQSNSLKAKNSLEEQQVPKKKIEKVVSGEVKLRKKNIFRRFGSIFIPEDVDSLKSYILIDVIIPGIKRAISDTVEAFLYNGDARSKTANGPRASKISYNQSFYDPRAIVPLESRGRMGFEYDDIILDSRREAEEVLIRMNEVIQIYGMVSVADLYDLVGRTGPYTQHNYGWTDLSTAKANPCREGYILVFPKVMPLK